MAGAVRDMTESAERVLRVGVVGVGVMGSNHARVLAGLPGIELAGVADPDRKQADFVARTLDCTAVADVGELLDLNVDAITIAAPTSWWKSRLPRRSRKAARSSPRRAAPA
jgi:predicted homoserine dehydrogenase-like protein